MDAGIALRNPDNKILTMAIFLLVVLCAMPHTVTARDNHDYRTPDTGGVCDVLREDGITKGLYRLCVSYCEVPDHDDDGHKRHSRDDDDGHKRHSRDDDDGHERHSHHDRDEHERRHGHHDKDDRHKHRSRDKILKIYNKKKQAGDPDMPCIEPDVCPCWSTAELDAMIADGSVGACIRNGETTILVETTLYFAQSDQTGRCAYSNLPLVRNQNISADEALLCHAQVEAACQMVGQ